MGVPPYPLTPIPTKKTWLDRHASWKIPLGCLTVILLLGIFVCGVFALVSFSFHRSYVFNEAIARAERNPEVRNRIGVPLKPALLPEGKIEVSGSSGTAQMEIPVAGPRGKATIRLDAREISGTWRFSVLEIEFEGETQWVNLVAPEDSTTAPDP